MGTEQRFLHQLQEMLGEQIYSRRDSEYWHGKAVEIAISFLPSESPLVSHILMSYEKHHSPSNQTIVREILFKYKAGGRAAGGADQGGQAGQGDRV